MGASVEVGQVREFEVASTAKTMRMFADQVYQHKVPAAIREIVFNGYDAQVAAGCKDRPLIIHLPSVAEQWFSVIDNGIGMSPEFVDTTYRVYGASSKDKESAADIVGRLGLGAKAPLAVAEKFEMISRHDGMKTRYLIFWGNNGKPQSLVQGHEPTSEGNGVEVRWAVPSHKIAEYRSEVEKLCAYFRPLPQITGLTTTEKFKPAEVVLARDGEGKGFRFRHRSGAFSRHDGTRAVMGMIVYPIKSHAIGALTAIQSGILEMPLDIDFKLGALEFTPGREDLSYDDRTVRAIKSRLNEIAAELRTKIDARYASCETRLAAHRLFRTIAATQDQVLASIQRVVGARWRKEPITSGSFDVTRKAFPNLSITVTQVIRASDGGRARRAVSELGSHPDSQIGIPATMHLTVYQDDLERGAKSRYIERVKTEDHIRDAVNVLVSGPQAEMDALMVYLDGVLSFPLSRYVPAKIERPKTSIKVLSRRDHGMISKDTLFDDDIDLVKERGFYVTTRMGNLEGMEPRAFKNLYEVAVETKLFDPWKERFIIVPASLLKDVERTGNWKPMVPELYERARKFVAKPDSALAHAKGSMHYDLALRHDAEGLGEVPGRLERLAECLPAEHDIARLAARMTDYGQSWEPYCILNRIIAAYNLQVEQPDLGPTLRAEYAVLMERYSFLPVLLRAEPRMNWRDDDAEKAHERALEKHYADFVTYVLLLDGQTGPVTPSAAPVPAGRRKALGSAKDKPWKVPRRSGRARMSA